MHKVASSLNIYQSHPAWPEVTAICQRLVEKGFVAFLAGGCVRDLVLGRIPKDFDIATNANPDQILELYPKALSVGREFGVIILAYPNFQIEIASFRKDGPYLDGRRPSHISFASAEEDARRRDFTMNALFLNPIDKMLMDYVGGLEDIAARLIRTVGEAKLRFEEDKLRMLRALRFSSQLDFHLDPATFSAIQNQSESISQVSKERIKEEIIKWLESFKPYLCFDALWKTNLLHNLHSSFKTLFKEHHFKQLMTIFSTDLTSIHLMTKISILFAFIVEKNQPDDFTYLKQSLKDLKFSNSESLHISWTLTNYFKLLDFNQVRLSDQIEISASPFWNTLQEFTQLMNPPLAQSLKSHLNFLRSEYLMDGHLPLAFLSGEILKNLGFRPGPKMGAVLKESYELQIEKKIISVEEALNFAKSKLK